MKKLAIFAAVAALSTAPAFAGFNADVHGGISRFSALGSNGGTQFSYGAGLGYDFDVSKTVFVGPQVGIDGETVSSGFSGVNLSAVIRAGVKVSPADKLYVLGGYANQSASGTSVDGWRLGAGYERSFGKMMFAKVEYRHTEYKSGGITLQQNAGLLGVGVHF